MLVDVMMVPELIDEERLKGKTAVVLDIFRATTTIVTALNNGCEEVYPVSTVERAWENAERLSHEGYLSEFSEYMLEAGDIFLGGERGAVKIDRFDLGNSPQEYTKEKISGKKLIITTTNGTKAIEKSKMADRLLIGSFLNAKAVSDSAFNLGNDIVIVCSGTDDALSAEDVCCAGLIVDNLMGAGAALTDAAICAREIYCANKGGLDQFLSRTKHYNILKQKGFSDDIAYSLQIDTVSIVPLYKDGKITLGEII